MPKRLKQFGGLKGVRDENLLASAVLAPQSTFGGKSPYAPAETTSSQDKINAPLLRFPLSPTDH